jgi:hypothetical protein
MRRAFATLVAAGLMLALGACETASTLTGAADYDSLSRATSACTAQGGKLVLKDAGDPQRIQDWVCRKG